MRQRLLLAQAARVVLDGTKQPYICHQCLNQARSRALHTSVPQHATQEPTWRKFMKSIIGSKEADGKTRATDRSATEKEDTSGAGEFIKAQTIHVDGKEYNLATKVSPRTDKEYLQATNGSGLETIGSERWLKKMADQGEQYTSFIPSKLTKLSNEQWQSLLRAMLTRMLLLIKNGHSMNTATNLINASISTPKVVYRVDGSNVELMMTSAENEQQVLVDLKEGTSEGQLSKTVNARPGKDHSWMRVPLNSDMKLALVTHIARLTGHRVPDLAITKATTAGDIYRAVSTQPVPKKLSRTKQVQTLAIDLPNVSVFHVRQTPIHKEKRVGRWKIIEQELVSRGLPVTGNRHVGAKITSTTSPVVKKAKKKYSSKKGTKLRS